jgi:nicotinate-nucleotide adenylyltransferase
VASPIRIGILGGTFDPVHIGHLVAANEARTALALDRTLLVVAPDPWQKRHRSIAPAEIRFEMVQAAVALIPELEVSRIELDRPGPTYTIDTVNEFDPDPFDVHLIVGADVAARINTWYRGDELRDRVTLVVVTREGQDKVIPDGWKVESVEMPRLDISSSEIRDRVAAGRPIDVLVPDAAVRVLRAHGLYTRR